MSMGAAIRLEGAVVAISGSGRGIGLSIAKAMAAQGARVALGDIDTALAVDAARELDERHRQGATKWAYGGTLDVRDRASFAAFLDATRRELGPVDVLVNNAGIMPIGAFDAESDRISDTQIDVNLRGVIHGCKEALPAMVARGRGHVVNVASLAGVMPLPGLAVYCATKFAVVGLTQSLREEYRDSGVHFSTIMPSKVTTDLAMGSDRAAKGIPTVSPEHVADAVVDAVLRRRTEVAVPKYLGVAPAMIDLTPAWLMQRFRKAIGDRRVLTKIDHAARAPYTERIEALAARGGAK